MPSSIRPLGAVVRSPRSALGTRARSPWADGRGVAWVFGCVMLALGCGGPSRAAGWELERESEGFGWWLSAWAPPGGPRYLVGGTNQHGRIVSDATGVLAEVMGVPEGPLLNWVFGWTADDLFVVGNSGTVLHFDGDTWERNDTPTTEALWGVWGAAPDDVWAVGGAGRAGSTPVLLHYDGLSWRSVDPPTFGRPGVTALYKVWGTAADNVYAVGRAGVILHYDGDTWSEEASGTGDDLIALHGSGPDEIVVVGGRSNGRVVIWDGSTWRSESLAPLPGLNGVFMRTAGVAHLVGVEGTIARLDLVNLVFREEVPATRLDFHAVFGDDSGVLTAVGGNFSEAPGAEQGVSFVRALARDE
ncbi:MAG: hypothetical protein R3B40_10105 [Polyangiales bacterium]|nr:hypothetical protein [Myxococcales bacterium]